MAVGVLLRARPPVMMHQVDKPAVGVGVGVVMMMMLMMATCLPCCGCCCL